MSDASDPPDASDHRFHSVDCFNRAWELIDKQGRSPEEDERMLLLAVASLWHWTRREDRTPRNLAVGYWQVSRVYALLGWAGHAARYAAGCLRHAAGEPPFYRAHGHEAAARAAKVAGDGDAAGRHLAEARALAARVADPEERRMLERDLDSLA